MDLYRQLILDHYKHPRNFGQLPSKTSSFSLSNTSCGDRITIEVLLQIKKGTRYIKDIRFLGVGCAISQAAASLLTEKVKKMQVTAVYKLDTNAVFTLLNTKLTPSRVKCATLPLEALHQALAKVG